MSSCLLSAACCDNIDHRGLLIHSCLDINSLCLSALENPLNPPRNTINISFLSWYSMQQLNFSLFLKCGLELLFFSFLSSLSVRLTWAQLLSQIDQVDNNPGWPAIDDNNTALHLLLTFTYLPSTSPDYLSFSSLSVFPPSFLPAATRLLSTPLISDSWTSL